MITTWSEFDIQTRLKSALLIDRYIKNWVNSKNIESAVFSSATTNLEYINEVKRIIHNIKSIPNLKNYKEKLVFMSDSECASGSIIDKITKEIQKNELHFEQLLQEKYDQVNQGEYRSGIKCRRCGSLDINWDQKQTRGADEAMTIFCKCSDCNSRWKM